MTSKRALQVHWGRVGGLRTAARHDTRDITAPARAAFEQRFYFGIPDDLPKAERDRRAADARRAYFADLTAKSIKARMTSLEPVGRDEAPSPPKSRRGQEAPLE